jgi:hypothetical protein
MRSSNFARRMLMASAIALWCGIFVFAGTAAAQSVTCTGNQSLGPDGFGDTCMSSVSTGPQGPSTATATASDSPFGSDATSTASNNSAATSNASDGSIASADASNSSTASASAADESVAEALSSGSGHANATASEESAAIAGSTSSGNAYADAVDGGEAEAVVSTANGFACAFAADGSAADASDTSAPFCDGPDAVVVSSAGNCGAADNSPCAFELHNYFSNANTSGGQAAVNITAPIEGISGAPTPALQKGETCAMIYIFDTAQNMQACCGCPITADGLLTLSISGNLATSPVGSTSLLMDGSIRIMPTFPNATPPAPGDSLFPGENCDASTAVCCDPGGRAAGNVVAPGSKLVAWAQHIQSAQITESEFQTNAPTAVELNDGLPQTCADITALGTGTGQCTCPGGGG